MRPALALEHFEHRDFVVRQRIAFDELQMLRFEPRLARALDLFNSQGFDPIQHGQALADKRCRVTP